MRTYTSIIWDYTSVTWETRLLNREAFQWFAPWRWILRLSAAARRAVAVRRSIKQLSELEDYLLCDIGITRSGIEHAALFGRSMPPDLTVDQREDF